MIYQTLHTPPITPEESRWLETLLLLDHGVLRQALQHYFKSLLLIRDFLVMVFLKVMWGVVLLYYGTTIFTLLITRLVQ